MPTDFLFPGGILSLPREAASRLLQKGEGDAALLYLALLSGQSPNLPEDRRRKAYETLVALALADPQAESIPAKTVKPEPDEAPNYTPGDVSKALKEGGFPRLVEELQRTLGKILSHNDLVTLLLLTDYLALPPEVILLLTAHCTEEVARKSGPGRKPTLPQLKKEAFRWHRLGIDSLEGAEAYLREREAWSRESLGLAAAVGIQGRPPIEAERRYLEAWREMGFGEEAVRLAYEKTILKKQAMNWPYLNSILKSWHQKGLHTIEQVRAEDAGRWKKPNIPVKPGGESAQNPAQLQKDFDRLDKLLGESGGGEP